MLSTVDQPRPLPAFLRALRAETWPWRWISQEELAAAFAAERATSVRLISSWERVSSRKPPSMSRLEAYARFFATSRSIETTMPRLLTVDQLTTSERARYGELLAELIALQSALISGDGSGSIATTPPPNGLWHFPDGSAIVILCATRSADQIQPWGDPTEEKHPYRSELYTFANLDALVDLFGHLRALNPQSDVTFKPAHHLELDDFACHLILLGDVDRSFLIYDNHPLANIPVRRTTRTDGDQPDGFEVTRDNEKHLFTATIERDALIEDVAYIYRCRNPFNTSRTLTLYSGTTGPGTYGAVHALTDVRFRDRNDDYARNSLEQHDTFGLLMRVPIIAGTALTPDWTIKDIRLHQWPDDRNVT